MRGGQQRPTSLLRLAVQHTQQCKLSGRKSTALALLFTADFCLLISPPLPDALPAATSRQLLWRCFLPHWCPPFAQNGEFVSVLRQVPMLTPTGCLHRVGCGKGARFPCNTGLQTDSLEHVTDFCRPLHASPCEPDYTDCSEHH